MLVKNTSGETIPTNCAVIVKLDNAELPMFKRVVPKILNEYPLSIIISVISAPPNVRTSVNVVYKFTGTTLLSA